MININEYLINRKTKDTRQKIFNLVKKLYKKGYKEIDYKTLNIDLIFGIYNTEVDLADQDINDFEYFIYDPEDNTVHIGVSNDYEGNFELDISNVEFTSPEDDDITNTIIKALEKLC